MPRSFRFGSLTALAGAIIVLATSPLLAVQAHLSSTQDGTNYSYSVFNDEPLSSPLSILSLHLAINAPVSILSTPPGWSVATDGATYIDWYCTNSSQPFANDIAPGASLTNFVIASVSAASEPLEVSLGAWDNGAGAQSSNYVASVPVPSILDYSPGITNAVLSSAGVFHFDVVGATTIPYEIQSTTNLVDWVSRSTNAAPFSFTDTATNTMNVYRVRYHSDQE